jgi:hypothetical protein
VGKILSFNIFLPGEGINFLSLIYCHLADDVSCCPETIDSQALYAGIFCGQAVRPVADEPGTHEWCSLSIRIGWWYRETVSVAPRPGFRGESRNRIRLGRIE